MFSIIKQIGYWTTTANNDIVTAELLINNNKLIEGLFFCHLSIEKILKAHVVKATGNLAPKTHNLNYLTELAQVSITEEHLIHLGILMKYQLEGRYPEYYPASPTIETTTDYFLKTKTLLICLEQML